MQLELPEWYCLCQFHGSCLQGDLSQPPPQLGTPHDRTGFLFLLPVCLMSTSSGFVALCPGSPANPRTGSGFERVYCRRTVEEIPSQADSDWLAETCGVGRVKCFRLLPEKTGDTVPDCYQGHPRQHRFPPPSTEPMMNAGTDEYQPHEQATPATERANRFAADA